MDMPGFDLRAKWQAAKNAAARFNGGRPIDIDKQIRGFALGPRLDAWEKAAKALDLAKRTDREAAALTDFRAADRAASEALAVYTKWLTGSEVALRSINGQARAELVAALTAISAPMISERKRLDPQTPPWKPDPPPTDPPLEAPAEPDPPHDPSLGSPLDPPLEPDPAADPESPHESPHDPPHEGSGHGGGHGGGRSQA